jgi:hypothetical protein
MSEIVAIKMVLPNELHLHPGRTKHTILDKQGRRDYSPFVSLLVTEIQEQAEFIMWRFCANGEKAHTHHDTLADALSQAEFEFQVTPGEWIDMKDECGDLNEWAKRKKIF